ncbi:MULTISPECIES: hypothetical protein [Streptomyces]|uniref:hypothetical protein n=1 Tax=Streptomyces TaxID=1883 RepID=UPI00224915CF|nr:hypothetical protein [Streptomyces sp. JHD 1]MCX2968403.1 hypothetical protein [Streptomyces sp. JHD 1]
MSTSAPVPLDHLVDTARYPLSDPASAAGQAVVSRARRELADRGCTVLPDFVRPELRETMRRECADLAPHAHYDVETVNVYNISVDTDLPPDHPGRRTYRRGNAFVPRDRLPGDALISRLYTHPHFRAFLARCFGLPALHELADPLSGLVLNVVAPSPGCRRPGSGAVNGASSPSGPSGAARTGAVSPAARSAPAPTPRPDPARDAPPPRAGRPARSPRRVARRRPVRRARGKEPGEWGREANRGSCQRS